MGWFFGNKKEDKLSQDRIELPDLPESDISLMQTEREPELEIAPITHLTEVKEGYSRTISPPRTFQQTKPEPIFVRLDKFETTVEAIETIKEKIAEMEKLIIKDKQLKEQEEKELDQWEKEIEVIKSRMDSIDKSLFEKLG